MARFYVTFLGRRRGAVGQSWAYARILTATSASEAVRACYRTHEYLECAEVRELDPNAPALPHDRMRLRPGVALGCGQPCVDCYVMPMNNAAHRALSAGHARPEGLRA